MRIESVTRRNLLEAIRTALLLGDQLIERRNRRSEEEEGEIDTQALGSSLAPSANWHSISH